MVGIIDKPDDNWGWVSLADDSWVCFENGEREKLTTKHVLIERGKYAGTRLLDLDDAWYLNFMKKQGVENGDVFLLKCANLRLLELN